MTIVTDRHFAVPTADSMRDLGEAIGAVCGGGDVLVLTGDLGAGKTTFTQGLARGLGIDERVTSPTFVIARTHPHPGPGADLVHVDAYRLGSTVELDDLDLDADLPSSVVVVEWGGGIADGLSPDRLEIVITRSDDAGDDSRTVTIASSGGRWDALLATEALAGWQA